MPISWGCGSWCGACNDSRSMSDSKDLGYRNESRPSGLKPAEKRAFGNRIEERAAQWYTANRGARVIARNFLKRTGEIDLILEEKLPDGRYELVFVEVRARDPRSWVSGIESVSFPKQRRLQRTAEIFLSQYRGKATRLRFDVMSWDGESWERIHNARLGDAGAGNR